MTFSLLARDDKTGKLGSVAATGNLCVGGWVLAGDAGAGIVASQGQAPSTLWRGQAITLMGSGSDAAQAVSLTVAPDDGREHRQLIALDVRGGTGAFTGNRNGDYKGHLKGAGCVASGNILAGPQVLEAMIDTFAGSALCLEDRLLEAIRAGERAGGDERGIDSAAMLVISPDMAPLTLRIDFHENPVAALGELLARTRKQSYQDWLNTVPTHTDPYRHMPKVPTLTETGTL